MITPYFIAKILSIIFQIVGIASFCICREQDLVFLFLFMCHSIRCAIKSNIVQHDGLSDHAFIITSYKKNIFSREKFLLLTWCDIWSIGLYWSEATQPLNKRMWWAFYYYFCLTRPTSFIEFQFDHGSVNLPIDFENEI